MSETTLREAINQVNIMGIVSEVDIEEKLAEGKEAIAGKLTIRTEDGSEHEIDMFAKKLKNDGGENAIYKGIQTIKAEFKSIASTGSAETADKVSITNARLGISDYYNKGGELRSIPKINASFVNRLIKQEELDKYKSSATFAIELYITDIKKEVNKETEETGRKLIVGFLPVYNGKIVPFTVTVGTDLADAVEQMYGAGQTVKLWGTIVNKVIKEAVTEAAGIGASRESVSKITTREFIMTGGSEPYVEDIKMFNKDAIRNAGVTRKEDLDKLKEKTNKDGVKNSAVKPTSTTTPASDDDTVLPF